MPTSPISEVIQHLLSALLPEAAGPTDGHLLECFVSRREPAALEALVRRHGPMVWGVCRRVLGNHHDAEDAFQATFLVLVRRAASIFPRAKVGNWLYGVAHQTALKANATRAKRRARERPETEMPDPIVAEHDLWGDLQPLLDQEVIQLPEKYRTVLVLCDLEGKTGREAARQLGCPQGTVASRLARARTMLARRLARHGLAVSSGTLAGALAQQSASASASVPPPVLSSTIKVVTLVAAGQFAAKELISVKVAALSQGVLKTMLLTQLKTVTAALVALGVVAFGAGLYTHQAGAQHDPADRSPAAAEKETMRVEASPSSAPGGRGKPEPDEKPEPMTDPKDAIDALEKQHVTLERDKSGFVIHARLPVKGILLDEATPHLKRLPKLVYVACNADNLSTDGFRGLGALHSLVEFELNANKVWSAMPWKDLQNVRTVRLSGHGIDDALLEAVGGMPAVTSVHLNGVAATADGLAHLKQLSGLESVVIQASNVTADGVKSLLGIEKLRSLTLSSNDIGAAGFAHLGTLTRLEYLNLESTRCTDADVASLSRLANLTELDLGYNAGVTDAGLRHLAGLKKLVGLRLYEANVTDDGVADLKKALSKLCVGK